MSSLAHDKTKAPLRDRMIPWYFVMAFMVVFTVNGIFISLALSTHPGLVTENPYEKGLAYNEVITKTAAQNALGWQGDVAYADGVLRYTLADKAGDAINNAAVTAHIARPLEKDLTVEFTLAPQGNGVYSTPIEFPLQGQWQITVHTVWKQQSHQHSQRLVVR